MLALSSIGRHHRNVLLYCFAAFVLSAYGPTGTIAASSLRRSAIVKAVAKARPAVVNIHGRKELPVEYDPGRASEAGSQVNGMGTGTIIDERGYIVTNYHVIEGVSRIRVTLADETTTVAQLVARDPRTDLAVIKISEDAPLPVISIGTSEDLMPGETVVAVGNAYGYEHTVTQGIVSALHRSVQVSDYQSYKDLIQTDASINPGSSGGPLLNIDGEMIGMNVAVRVGAQGIGFAIPVNEVVEVAAALMGEGQVSGVTHGATLKTEYTPSSSQVLTESVRDDSPAEKAGLKSGDVVLSVDDHSISRRLDFERALLRRKVGEELAMEVRRDDQVLELSLVLGKGSGGDTPVTDQAWEQIGLDLMPIESKTFHRYRTRYRGGLKITSVRADSPAYKHGIQRGDILLGLHKWETVSLDNIAYILNNAEFKSAQPFRFYILRGKDTLYGSMKTGSD